MKLSWLVMGTIQALLLLLFSLSIVPAWYVGNFVTKDSTVEIFDVNGRFLKRTDVVPTCHLRLVVRLLIEFGCL
jgi:hypothetical protein